MLWAVVALLSAFFASGYNLIMRKLIRQMNPYLAAAGTFLGGGLLLSAVAAFVSPLEIGAAFVLLLLLVVALVALGFIFFFRALALSDLIDIIPLLALSPFFSLVTHHLLAGGAWGTEAAGIILIAMGSLLVLFKIDGEPRQRKELLAKRGVRLALAAALCFGVAGNFMEAMIGVSDPYLASAFLLLALGSFFILVSLGVGGLKRQPAGALPWLIIGSGLNALMILAFSVALSLQSAPYVTALNQASGAFTILVGGYLFHKEHFSRRVAAFIVVCFGLVLVALQV